MQSIKLLQLVPQSKCHIAPFHIPTHETYQTIIWLKHKCNNDTATEICRIKIFPIKSLQTHRLKLILIGKCIKFWWHRYNVSLMRLMRNTLLKQCQEFTSSKKKRYAYFLFCFSLWSCAIHYLHFIHFLSLWIMILNVL